MDLGGLWGHKPRDGLGHDPILNKKAIFGWKLPFIICSHDLRPHRPFCFHALHQGFFHNGNEDGSISSFPEVQRNG